MTRNRTLIKQWNRLNDENISDLEYGALYSHYGSRRLDMKFYDRKPADYIEEQIDHELCQWHRTVEMDAYLQAEEARKHQEYMDSYGELELEMSGCDI